MEYDHRYDDMLEMKYTGSKKYPKMSNYERAAQFSPFAALVGHGDAINETIRLTEKQYDTIKSEMQE